MGYLQLGLAWLLSKHGVTAPLIGATRTQHLDDAVAALGIRLKQQETARLEALLGSMQRCQVLPGEARTQ